MMKNPIATSLVTGGAGFIGSHLVDGLLEAGHRVRVLDNLAGGRLENLERARSTAAAGRLEFIEGDIRRDEDLAGALRGVEYVFHLAALGSVERSVADPLGTHEVNSTGTLRLLLAAREAGVKRFVFAGSSSVYGDLESLPKTEEMPTLPISPYGLSKLDGEIHCRLFARLSGLETVTLRYFNVFGPRQNPASQYAAVIPLFVDRILRGLPPRIDSDGEQSRDFTYVENVVRANLLALRVPAEKVSGKVINVACGDRHSINQLVAVLERQLGRPVTPEHRPPRPGDVRHSQADITKARQLLGFEPSVSFEEGLKRTVEAHQREMGGLGPIEEYWL